LRVVRLRTLILVGVSFFVAANVFVPGYFYRIQSLSDISQVGVDGAEGVDGSLKGRTTENLAALKIFLEHPILGVGPGQTKYYIRLVANEIGIRRIEVERRAHIMYYEELADTGIVGFAGLMSIVLLIMFQLYRLMRRYKKVDIEIYYTAAGLLLAIISYLATAAFLHLSYVRYYFFLLAFAAAAVQVYQTWASNSQEHPPRAAESLTG